MRHSGPNRANFRRYTFNRMDGNPAARWDRAFELFHRALDLAEAERERWLLATCDGDRELLEEVRSLLASHARSNGPLDRPAAHEPLSALIEQRLLGQRIGPYLLSSVLGEGGMGIVFRAEQQQPIRRTVALKLIKPGMDTREVLARFANERQLLARLEHPHIAAVFDAGHTEDGHPYFAMELVEGVSITKYCDQQRLTTDDRLRLMIAVCGAVQHAHQRGIIHRDLKPSNILVRETEGKAVPKVIDFGVAKALDPTEGGQEPVLTRHGRVIGTPEYMSPEQVTPAAGVDTRSDIYSLGVVLYQLLSGFLPFPSERLRDVSEQETRRILCEEEPRSPSTQISGNSFGLDEIAAQRRTDPGGLRQQLRGELDWIVMRALEKHPARRYANVSDLAADLERQLAHLPVSVGPPSRMYRARKFVRRHRYAVSTAAIVTVGIAAFTVTTAVQSQRIERLLEQTSAERDRAEQVSEFLVDLFALQDPVKLQGESMTARELLDRKRERAMAELAEQPALQADLLDTLASAYRNLGVLETALELHQRALTNRRQLFGDEHLETARSWYHLGATELERAQLEPAVEHLMRAQQIRQRELGAQAEDTLQATLRLAAAHRIASRFEAARQLLIPAIEAVDRQPSESTRKLQLQLHSELAVGWMRQGRYQEARAEFERALALPAAGENGLVLADLRNSFGAMLLEQGDLAAAEPLLRGALETRERLLGERSSRAIATLANVALLEHRQGALDVSEAHYRLVLDRQRQIFGRQDRQVASTLHNLALLRRDRGDWDAAERFVREALEIQRHAVGPQHPDTAYHHTLLGNILRQSGRLDQAEAELRAALTIRRARLAPTHPELATTLLGLGRVLIATGRRAEAEPLLREALEIRQRSLVPTDSRIGEVEQSLAECSATTASTTRDVATRARRSKVD